MKSRGDWYSWVVGPVVVLALLIAAVPKPARADLSTNTTTLALVVSTDSKTSELSLRQLGLIFRSQPVTSPSGKRFVAFNHPPRTPDRVGFDRVVLGMTPEEVARYWIDRRIRDGARAPRTVDSVTTLKRVVQHLPSAIAYLNVDQVDGDLRILTIDGKRPGEPGYPVVYRR